MTLCVRHASPPHPRPVLGLAPWQDDVLIRGKNGLLIAGPSARLHEPMLVEYLSLLSREMFLRVFFVRSFLLSAALTEVRAMLGRHTEDPNLVTQIRSKLSDTARDIVSYDTTHALPAAPRLSRRKTSE